MKVLFVCRYNVGRSQVARAFFDRLSRHESDSAGTRADEAIARLKLASRMLKHAGNQVSVAYMKAQGIDISENVRKQLTLELMDEADQVIVMAEKNTWPDYLSSSEKTVVGTSPIRPP